jgi:transposase
MYVVRNLHTRTGGPPMQATIVGIDLAKEVFQIHGNDAKGRRVFVKKIRRSHLLEFFETLPKTTVAMEACSGAHWLARKLIAMGHTALLIAPQFVKPFVKSNKNDAADAEAICEAASRPSMHFVAVKGSSHLDIQAIHRVRSCRVARRTAICNEIRALGAESGVVFARGATNVRKLVVAIVADMTNDLTSLTRQLMIDLHREMLELDERIEALSDQLESIAKQDEASARLLAVGGVGPMTATALVAACPDPSMFRNGRQFAAWLGLVPRHSGSGGKNRIGGMSKRGDSYLRTLLIHGARSVILRSAKSKDPRSAWIQAIRERRGANRAAVALANKNARVLWSLLHRGDDYRRVA